MLLWYGKNMIMKWLDRQPLLELREQSVDAELGEIPLKIRNVARVFPHKHLCCVDFCFSPSPVRAVFHECIAVIRFCSLWSTLRFGICLDIFCHLSSYA